MKKLLLNLLFAVMMVPWVTQGQEISEYIFTENTGVYTSIASTGDDTGIADDDEAVLVSLPFAFPFGMESYNSVYVTSNGQLSFNADPVLSSGAYDVSVYTGNYSMIVPLGHDLNPASGGKVYVDSSDASVFVVEWDSIRPYTGFANTFYCFQVKLYPSGNIEMCYGPMVVGTTHTDVVVRLKEAGLGNVLNVTGGSLWTNVSTSFATAVSNKTLDSAAFPASGTIYEFTRPIITCPRPSSLVMTSNTLTSVSLAWLDTLNANSTWDVAYGPSGFHPDSIDITEVGVIIPGIVTDTVTIGNLSTDTLYDFYVRSDCGGDYSTWRGVVTARPGIVNMGITGSSSITGCGFTVYDNGGSTAAYANSCNYTLTIYPSSEDSLVSLYGTLLAESIDKLTFYDGPSTSSPLIRTVAGAGSSSVVNIDRMISTGGPITINFYSDGSVTYAGFELFTSCMAVPVCAPVQNLNVPSTAARSAMITWSYWTAMAPAPTQAEVEIIDLDNNVVFSDNNFVTEPRFLAQGLEARTHYRARVRSVCEDGSFTDWDSIDFETPCMAGGDVVIGNGTTTTSYVPTYTVYDYSYSQQLFEASEMNGSTEIYGYQFEQTSSYNQTRQLDIYMAHTSQSTLTASTYIPLDSLTLVYSGSHNFVPGWNTIMFDSSFVYDGSSNLVLAVDDNTGTYVSSMTYRAHSVTGKVVYKYRDNTDIDPASPPTLSTLSSRGNTIFLSSCDTTITCVAPAIYVTAINNNSFDIVWAAGNEEASWTLEIKESTDSIWTVVEASTNNNAYSFTNLNYSTRYNVRVTAECGGDEASAVVTVYISCPPISVLPFTENFDTWTASSTAAIDSCWNRLSNYTSGSSQYPYVSSSYSLSASRSMYMYSTASTYSALILPPFETSIDSLQISFGLYKTTTGSYPIQVGVMVDPSDISTFTPIATADASQGYRWQMFEIPLNEYTGSGKYIALVSPDGVASYPYLDNIEVNLIPTCPRITGVEISGITQTSASVSWFDTVNSNCVVEYGPSGFTPGTGTMDLPTDSSSYLIQNLTSGTSYDVYVYRVCDDADTSSPSFVKTFRTVCDYISIPFSEDFETWTASSSLSASIDPCWNRMTTYYSSSMYPYVSTSYALSGTKGVYMYSTNTSYSVLVLPGISNQIDSLQISFGLFKTNTSYTHAIHVGVMTDPYDISTFVPVDTVAPSALNTWEMFEVPLNTYTGTGKHIALLSPNGAYSYPYLDNIEVDVIPTCPRPRDVVSVGTHPDTIIVDWTEFGTATEWQICYGPAPIDPTLGQGTLISGVYSHPYTITNLSNDTIYNVYVRSICGPGDTSNWAFSYVTAAPGSYNMPTSGIDTIRMCSGWIYDNGGPNANYSASVNGTVIIYPSSPMNVVSISGSYTGESCCDYLRIYDGVGTSATELYNDYGSVSNLEFTSTTGPLTIQFTSDGSGQYAGFAFNVQCISNTCPRVQDLAATYVTNTTMILDWTETGPATEWEVAYGPRGFDIDSVGLGSRVVVNAHPCTLNYLTPMTRYDVYVRGLCDVGDTAGWRKITVTTGYCDAPVINEISDSVQGSTYMYPFNSFYNYSYTQQIYYPGEIDTLETGEPMDISALAFQYFYNTPEQRANVEIYLGHVQDSVFASTSSWVRDTLLTKVFEGDIEWNNEGNGNWFEIQLDTVFTYNNTDNLVVVMLDGNGDYSNSTAKLYTHTTGVNNAMEYHTDSSPINMAAPSSGTRHTYRSNIRFISCDPCSMPSTATIEPGSTSAVVTFANVGNYEISYKTTIAADWSDNISVVNADTYTVTGLQPETEYDFRLRTVCDSTTMSGWYMLPIMTLELPCVAPVDFSASNIAYTSATVAWVDSSNNQEAWKVAYGFGNDASAWDTVDVTTPSIDIDGLYYNTEYTVYVRAYCSVEADVYADWSPAFTFRTASCEGVTNVVANDITAEGATISWTAPAGQTKWEISYGLEGVLEDNGNKRIVENTPVYTITGLESEFTYDVYVRSICQDGVYSAWSTKAQFRTTRNGINTASADNVKVQIYPNPANSEATVTVDGITGEAEFVLADMNGRIIVTETVNCEGSLVKTINVSNLAKGAYFVHIYNNDFNTTRKLIVK